MFLKCVCCKGIKSGTTFLVSQKKLLILFLDLHSGRKSVSSFEWISYLYSFFLLACLWEVIKFPFSLVFDTKSTKISFSLLQNISQNYSVNPLLPGELSLYMLFKELYKSFLVKSPLQTFTWLRENFGKSASQSTSKSTSTSHRVPSAMWS